MHTADSTMPQQSTCHMQPSKSSGHSVQPLNNCPRLTACEQQRATQDSQLFLIARAEPSMQAPAAQAHYQPAQLTWHLMKGMSLFTAGALGSSFLPPMPPN
eukprot:1158546-Pelagomonas_calceolata.AAC.5